MDREVRDAAVEVPPLKTPIKMEPSSGVTPGMSQKKRLLAKGHRDWIITEPKTEPRESSKYPTEGNVDKNKAIHYPSSSTLRHGSYEYLEAHRRNRGKDMKGSRG